MSWNYRVVRHIGTATVGGREFDNSHLSVHEVHYDEAGNPNGYSTEPISFSCDLDEGKDGIIASLKRALKTIRSTDILDASHFAD